MRKFSWVVPVVVSVCLMGYFLAWPWFRDRGDTEAIETLTADLKSASAEIDRAIAEAPETPKLNDVERFAQLNKKMRDLVPRMRDVAPKLKGEAGRQFREAQDEYLKKNRPHGRQAYGHEEKG